MSTDDRFMRGLSVCVIIPFWNGSAWVERAIQSVIDQTIPPDEFIIVNDGSSVDERKKLEEISAHYGVRVLDKENGGQGAARNFGVAACKSDWVCFLDQDDFFLPEHIEILSDCLRESSCPPDVVYGSFHLADSTGMVHIENALEKTQPGCHPPSVDPIAVYGRNLSILPSATMISKSVFVEAGGFDAQFRGYEDDDLFARLILSGMKFCYVPRAVYVWCQHKGSSTWSGTMSRSRFLFYVKVRSQFIGESGFLSRDMAAALEDRFGRFFYKSAAYAKIQSDDNKGVELNILRNYVSDVVVDDLGWTSRAIYKTRLWVLERSGWFPMSLFFAAKRFNRVRVESRRVRDGRQFLQ